MDPILIAQNIPYSTACESYIFTHYFPLKQLLW